MTLSFPACDSTVFEGTVFGVHTDFDRKKLYLDTQNKKIAGVCAGLADYFNMDPTVLRIIFLITLIYGGLGFWAYIIVWALTPAKPLDPPVEQQ